MRIPFKASYLYTIFAFLLLLAEVLFISFQIDAWTLPAENYLARLLSFSGFLLKWFIVSSTVFLFLILFFHKEEMRNLFYPEKAPWYFWIIQICTYFLLLYLTLEIFKVNIRVNEWLVLVWLLLVFFTFLIWCRLLFTFSSLFKFTIAKKYILVFSIIIGSFILAAIVLSDALWDPLSLLALKSSAIVLSVFFDGVYVDVPNKLLGLNAFIISVAHACSGIEGLIISASVVVIFLYARRHELKFPISFALIPIALVLSLLFNILRIAVLAAIGAYISPDIAVQGFHSVAGWLSAALVSFLIIFWISSIKIFYKQSDQGKSIQKTLENNDAQLSWAMLVPFVVSLFSALVAHIFYQDFDYLYFLKVVVGGLALLYFWKTYQLPWPSKKLEPILAGFLIAILWLFLVPEDPEYNQNFTEGLESMSLALMLIWLCFRFIGFWLVAPIVEELVFRGYLMSRLSGKKVTIENNLDFSLLAIIGSSVIFGLVHGSFIAGFIAGIIFTAVRYRSKTLSEPILAHMVANFSLSIWALMTGQWVVL